MPCGLCGDAAHSALNHLPCGLCDDSHHSARDHLCEGCGNKGHRAADCTPGPRCGDGVVQADNEACDNGLNIDRYSTSADACAPGCTQPSFCGDSVVDPEFGEECDDGVNDNAYGGCSDICKLGPRCGDGVLGGAEACDDGNRVNGDGCNLSCETEREIVPT